ncbi:hypothetical protein WI72_12150 [Burkholderia ubonensis]|uniref:hypothetical protein n=1 Tax=Burkholderia ubonensis TaxID=101571 RepID=UPI00075BCFD4|nr:hypothetical protein [Burkholderia ubonensis]KVC61514.1 hypothetical protein WI72_12150 [Burkholderia ubonensis]
MNAALIPRQPKIYSIACVNHLVEDFQSRSGLELLVTVHWALGCEGTAQHDGVTRQIQHWNMRKREFTANKLAIAGND